MNEKYDLLAKIKVLNDSFFKPFNIEFPSNLKQYLILEDDSFFQTFDKASKSFKQVELEKALKEILVTLYDSKAPIAKSLKESNEVFYSIMDEESLNDIVSEKIKDIATDSNFYYFVAMNIEKQNLSKISELLKFNYFINNQLLEVMQISHIGDNFSNININHKDQLSLSLTYFTELKDFISSKFNNKESIEIDLDYFINFIDIPYIGKELDKKKSFINYLLSEETKSIQNNIKEASQYDNPSNLINTALQFMSFDDNENVFKIFNTGNDSIQKVYFSYELFFDINNFSENSLQQNKNALNTFLHGTILKSNYKIFNNQSTSTSNNKTNSIS